MIDILHMVQHVQVSKVVTNVCSQWLFHLCVKGLGLGLTLHVWPAGWVWAGAALG